jgi:hypothetical protein
VKKVSKKTVLIQIWQLPTKNELNYGKTQDKGFLK